MDNRNYQKYRKYKSKYQKLQKQLKHYGGIKGLSGNTAIHDTNYFLTYYILKYILPKKSFQNLITNQSLRVPTVFRQPRKQVYNYQNFDKLLEDINPTETMLMVIDMQNDFIDRPYPGLTGPEIGNGQRIGSFSVNNGAQVANDLMNFLHAYEDKFGTIVFTRDVHPEDHCSFFTHGGIFPPHCINMTAGSGLINEIKEFLRSPERKSHLGQVRKKYRVIFKGCHRNTDSFGAYSYKNDSYLPKRQMGDCCRQEGREIDCTRETGGFYYGSKDLQVLCNDCDASPQNLGRPFRISPSIKNVFVIGLAGDYCVCDTAVNIRKSRPDMNVNVIYELTRNAFIPFVGDENSFSHQLPNIQSEDPNKHLPNYAFARDLETGFFHNVPKENLPTITSQNLGNYWHFLTDHRDLLRRYKDNGVKLQMNIKDQLGIFSKLE